MQAFETNYNKDQLRRRIGNMDQVAGIELVQLDNGNERPVRAANFHTGSGLAFSVLLDRGMDIASASFQGRAMGWRSTTGNVAPQYFEAPGFRWLRNYFGGLVTTCGLTNVGGPAADSAEWGRGLHGRISNIPAKDIQVVQEWQGEDYVLSVTGTIREAVLFGENLVMKRTISTKLGDTRILLTDELTNEGFRETPYMLLYHCNIGWPALDAGSKLIAPSRYVAPRDETAKAGLNEHNVMDAPTPEYAEKVYYHDMAQDADGMTTVGVVNTGLDKGDGFGVYVKYSPEELPRFTQWKMMGEQDYVLGLEPCTCGVEGRQVDEELGLMHTLAPGASKTFHLEFGPITTQEEVDTLQASASAVKTEMAESYKSFVKKLA